jgi:hypothetical protein
MVAVCVAVWVPPSEIDGSSIVFREPRKRKSRITAIPSARPSAIPIARSPTLGMRPRVSPGFS